MYCLKLGIISSKTIKAQIVLGVEVHTQIEALHLAISRNNAKDDLCMTGYLIAS